MKRETISLTLNLQQARAIYRLVSPQCEDSCPAHSGCVQNRCVLYDVLNKLQDFIVEQEGAKK